MNTLSFKYEKPLKIKGDIISRLNSFFSKTREYSIIKNTQEKQGKIIEFFVKDIILEYPDNFRIQFVIINDELVSSEIMMHSQNEKINEYNLKNYITTLYQEILLSEHNCESINYTIRIYSKFLNSHQIRGEYEINNGYKTLIKPFVFKDKQEPLTEHIIQYDIEVSATNIEHARSLAINNAKDINCLLSLLLDTGFELVSSEFRNFVIMKDNNFTLNRFRTGFFDHELGLVVKDNLNGLKHIGDEEDIQSFFSGKVSFRALLDNGDGTPKLGDPIYFDATKKPLLEKTFENHKIKKDKKLQADYSNDIKQSRQYESEEIKIPRQIRNYFRNYNRLNKEKKEAFISCARMYNVSKISGRIEPTVSISYLICAIEVLATYHKTSFSKFIVNYGKEGFNKKMTDYFYGGVRSSHFHSGKFLFNENLISLQTESDFLFKEKLEEFNDFYDTARYTLINWINKEILSDLNQT